MLTDAVNTPVNGCGDGNHSETIITESMMIGIINTPGGLGIGASIPWTIGSG